MFQDAETEIEFSDAYCIRQNTRDLMQALCRVLRISECDRLEHEGQVYASGTGYTFMQLHFSVTDFENRVIE